ncbi:hypothetical protein N7478_007469 [Penicillium angulare]|uniref:uncharacterized protein n=1 Tax=Penicillium angulare TaxID=116970 RepID=UPI00253F7B0B|nr:uncharacterized protein N7478_007469 [Penicillium angulare]KAJ5272344.1 hypothetical protein N7478_007469 [Penicillium angulare]
MAFSISEFLRNRRIQASSSLLHSSRDPSSRSSSPNPEFDGNHGTPFLSKTSTRGRSRQKLRVTLWSIGITIVVILGYRLLLPQLLRFRFRSDLTWYDIGLYGFFPTQGYNSFLYDSPLLGFIETDSRCSRDYFFFAPNGDSIQEPGPVLLDADGELVWQLSEGLDGVTQDFRVQRYKDEDFLTFWVGHEIDGRKQGYWYMLDSSYSLRYTISPGGNFTTGDMHEFHLTPDGTALVVVYDPVPADLSAIGGARDGWILDGVVQELDIETGETRFEWRASEHFAVEDTFHGMAGCHETHAAAFSGCGNEPTSAFDFFHLNSVEKSSSGNFLISSRYTHTISEVNGIDGSVLWTLGGKSNNFKDLSADGSATGISWQHHARWYGDSSITLFDNAVEDNSDPSLESRGLIIDLDIEKREANLRVAFSHPQRMEAVSLGSTQVLEESGNIFIGWGHSAAFTEFAPDGSVLCDMHYGPSAWNTFGRIKSYRTFRGKWKGYPTQPPDVAFVDDALYVSWNGATEVERWQLEAIEEDGGTSHTVSQVFKSGFETEMIIPQHLQGSSIRVLGLDSKGSILGSSDVLEVSSEDGTTAILRSILVFPVLLVLVGIVWLALRQRLRRAPRGRKDYQLLPLRT